MSGLASVAALPLRSVRAAAAVQLGPAVSALARQSLLEWPIKLSLSPGSKPALLAELVDDRRDGDDDRRYDLAGMLEQGQAWLASALPDSGRRDRGQGLSGGDAASVELGEVGEALDSLGWQASDSGGGSWLVQEAKGATALSALTPGGRGLLRVGANGFVCFSQPPALIRVAAEHCSLALALLALETNERLQLARSSVDAPTDGDGLRVWWQAVLPIDERLAGMLEQALAASWVAREATLAAYRALATPALARAYLQTLNANGCQPQPLTNPKENVTWKQQAAI